MEKVKLTILHSDCRCGTCKTGDTFLVDTLCPPICHELWSCIYPMVYALQNGATLDYAEERATIFEANCPDEGRVTVRGELVPHPSPRNEYQESQFSIVEP